MIRIKKEGISSNLDQLSTSEKDSISRKVSIDTVYISINGYELNGQSI
tara:strand:- start:278 stop:421 length:144 start_codon:yes stop_codon:yes gene_type:complete